LIAGRVCDVEEVNSVRWPSVAGKTDEWRWRSFVCGAVNAAGWVSDRLGSAVFRRLAQERYTSQQSLAKAR